MAHEREDTIKRGEVLMLGRERCRDKTSRARILARASRAANDEQKKAGTRLFGRG